MDVLKNYSEINQSIVIKEGNEIKTISALKNILSRAVVKENFPKDFAIYDLPTFIGFHSTMSEPDFEFGDESMTLKDGNGKGKYFYAEPSLVVTPPEKPIDMPESDIKFELKNDIIEDIIKKANVLKLADIGLKSCPKSQGLYLYATNKNNDTSNDYSVKVGDGATKKFNIIFKKDNLKIYLAIIVLRLQMVFLILKVLIWIWNIGLHWKLIVIMVNNNVLLFIS